MVGHTLLSKMIYPKKSNRRSLFVLLICLAPISFLLLFTSSRSSFMKLHPLVDQNSTSITSSVTHTTTAEKCADPNLLPPFNFSGAMFKDHSKSQSGEDKTLLVNFCEFLLLTIDITCSLQNTHNMYCNICTSWWTL